MMNVVLQFITYLINHKCQITIDFEVSYFNVKQKDYKHKFTCKFNIKIVSCIYYYFIVLNHIKFQTKAVQKVQFRSLIMTIIMLILCTFVKKLHN